MRNVVSREVKSEGEEGNMLFYLLRNISDVEGKSG